MHKASRLAFWAAIVFGLLYLAAATASLAIGGLLAALMFAAAWGIRRGQPWAAMLGAGVLLLPVVMTLVRANIVDFRLAEVAVFAGFTLVAASIFGWAAVVLWRAPLAAHAAWPWVAVLLLFTAAVVIFQPFSIPTAAMEKTLLAGDRVLVETVSGWFNRSPARDELVVFRYPVDPRQTFIKRTIGVPGDRLRVANKRLYRNGVELSEPYTQHTTEYIDLYRDNFPSSPPQYAMPVAQTMLKEHVKAGELTVPAGKFFVMGDNRDNSLDSRYWGFITAADVVGTPVLIYDSHELLGGPSGATEGRRFPGKTRWNRLFRPVD